MNRLKGTPVLPGRDTRTTLEQSTKERRVVVPNRKGDLVNWLVRRLEQALGFFDAKILHVVDERQACPLA